MNRKMKTSMALLLCLVLCLSLFPASALAEGEPVKDEEVIMEDLPVLEEPEADNGTQFEEAPPVTEDAEELIAEEPETEETLSAAAGGKVVHSGTWYGIDWALDDAGTLVFSGEGRMENIGMNYREGWRPYAKDIRTVIFTPGITRIGGTAFWDCSNLTSVSIPSSITEIGWHAFNGCSSLPHVTIPASVTSIEAFVFYGCSKLKTAGPIGSGCDMEFGWTNEIPESAFNHCDCLVSVTIPPSVTRIGEGAFSDCSSLESVTIPERVTSIDAGLFYCCSALTSVSIPAGVTSIGDSAFGECSALTSISIPAGVTSIGSNAFAYCSSLTNISIPAGITSIEYGTFACCSGLTGVIIPAGVTNIDNFAFYSEDGRLAEIYFLGRPPEICDHAFEGVTATVHYPADKGWTAFNMCDYGGTLSWISDNRVTEFVTRCYRIILGREGEPEGVVNWVRALLSRQKAGAEIISDFIFSLEFVAQKHSDEDVVTILYRAMMDREPDAGGMANWLGHINNGMSYKYIITGFSTSPEFRGICASYGIEPGSVILDEPRDQNPQVTAFVSRNYLYALLRKGEPKGLNDWTNALLQKAQTPQQVAYGFVFSPECTGRGLSNRDFMEMLYHLYMGRDPDEAGLNNWVAALDSGLSREQIVENFSQSQEFRNIVASYGLA